MTTSNIFLAIIILVLLVFISRYKFLLRVSKDQIQELISENLKLKLEQMFASELAAEAKLRGEEPKKTGFEKMVEQAKKSHMRLYHSPKTGQWFTDKDHD